MFNSQAMEMMQVRNHISQSVSQIVIYEITFSKNKIVWSNRFGEHWVGKRRVFI
jgi:hypothetical protein